MSERLIAIGDIHGCATALRELLNAISPRTSDTIVTLGDYVDRGPDSRGVMDQIIALRRVCNVISLLGNHEEMFMKVLEGGSPQPWLQFGGNSTLESYQFDGNLNAIPKSHRDFLAGCLDYWESENFLFTHGNYQSDRPLAHQSIKILRWTKLSEIIPEPHISGKTAIVGHTPNREGEIFDLGYLKCLDTYCYGNKWLTGMELNSGKVWQFSEKGKPRS